MAFPLMTQFNEYFSYSMPTYGIGQLKMSAIGSLMLYLMKIAHAFDLEIALKTSYYYRQMAIYILKKDQSNGKRFKAALDDDFRAQLIQNLRA